VLVGNLWNADKIAEVCKMFDWPVVVVGLDYRESGGGRFTGKGRRGGGDDVLHVQDQIGAPNANFPRKGYWMPKKGQEGINAG